MKDLGYNKQLERKSILIHYFVTVTDAVKKLEVADGN